MLTASSSQRVIPINEDPVAATSQLVGSAIDDNHRLQIATIKKSGDEPNLHNDNPDLEVASDDSDNDDHNVGQAFDSSLEETSVKEDEDEQKRRAMAAALKQNRWVKRWNRFKEQLNYETIKSSARWALESATCTISFTFEDVVLVMTIYILFADDIKLMTTTRVVDWGFSTSYAVCFFVFMFELVSNSWSKSTVHSIVPFAVEGYFLSFFWFLDVISILSIIPDIRFMSRPLGIANLSSSVSGNHTLTQAGRVVRLVRLVRLVKLFRIASERRARREQEEALMELVRVGAIQYEEIEKQRMLYGQRQSKLGAQLSNSTTQRVIIMILVLLIIIPLLNYSPANDVQDFSMYLLHSFNANSSISTSAKQAMVESFLEEVKDAYNTKYVSYLEYSPSFGDDPVINRVSLLRSLRDVIKVTAERNTTLSSVSPMSFAYTKIIFDMQYLAQNQALYSILTTIFVGFMMVGGAVVFSNDAQRLVITPIERMMNLVDAVAANPLATFSFSDGENLAGNTPDANGKVRRAKPQEAGQYETKLLETTVEKITGLLRVGFGEAGAGIISANLSSEAGSSSATINPLLPGVRIYAIFGFCDIHHFEDINQKLANDVLVFVNSIAEIVHGNVHTWSGQCNKNLGNAFVIVWRIGDEESLSMYAQGGGGNKNRTSFTALGAGGQSGTASPDRGSIKRLGSMAAGEDDDGMIVRKAKTIDLRRIPGVDLLADHALIAYLRVIVEINRSKSVLKYRQEPRLTENGTQEFKVRMGFGLHAGWAIEGAVGSLQKVDATYLSPHVNMAARLETSSKQYGVPLLASQDFYDLLSQVAQSKCRRLDVVTVKGSEVPIGIYTYDALQDQEFRSDREQRKRGPSVDCLDPGATPNRGSFTNKDVATKDANNASAAGTGTGSATPILQPNAKSPSPLTGSPQRRPSISSVKDGVASGGNKAVIFTPNDETNVVFENDTDLLALRNHITDEFLQTFKDGVECYLSGEWKEAKMILERADSMMLEAAPVLGGDGPCKTLLQYMFERNFQTPKTWKGFRPLTSK